MGKILNLIEGNMNGDAWEDLCVRCYRMKYQEQHYVAIPAVHKGDAGIEGLPLCGGASVWRKEAERQRKRYWKSTHLEP